MPFLRRRGVMASESDMRRHTSFFNPLAISKQASPPPIRPETAIPESEVRKYSIQLPRFSSNVVAAAEQDRANAGGLDSLSLNTIAPSFPAPPITPPVDSIHQGEATRGAMSIESDMDRPESPPIQEQTPKHHRFSILRFRNASDSQLAARARQQALAEEMPPMPRPPEIITTAPTLELGSAAERLPGHRSAVRVRKSGELARIDDEGTPGGSGTSFRSWPKRDRRKSMVVQSTTDGKHSAVAFDESTFNQHGNPMLPEYGDDSGSALALPATRLSESSRSDGSSADRVYGSTTTTTHTVQTTTTFFRLPRRKNANPPPLFPIGHLPQKGRPITPSDTPVPAKRSYEGSTRNDISASSHAGGLYVLGEGQSTPTQSRPSSQNKALSTPSGVGPSPALVIFQKGNHSPASAFFRPSSRNSGRSSPTRTTPVPSSAAAMHLRGRSSTLSSLGRDSLEGNHPPPTVRSSSSATGRKSFGDLLGFSRLRQNSELSVRPGSLAPGTPSNNSLHLPRDSITLPERRDDDTPAKYLARLEEVVSRSVIASALSKSADQFSQAVLRSYMRSFRFFGDPMDMAIRKLLMEAELPKETQQIDRCLQAFANRYHECNPGIYNSPDQAYFIAFSLLILHTDVFNKNNKHKMQKQDYLKNTRGEGIFDEILEVFYDNITYTPFIHVEDELDINGDRIITHKAKRKYIFPNGNVDMAKKTSKEPIDPYTLIIDNKLDILRPNFQDAMQLEDPYSYIGTASSLNMKELQSTFFRTGILQIVSARSRPDAFMTLKTVTNPEEAHPGIVDIKITKVGLLWRKEAKRKKARSPWQEWGAILTGAQLYFFRNTTWVKSLIHQYEGHVRHGHDGIPVIFKPPLEEFKPDALISTDGAVALLDSSYKKHKHAFTYVRRGGDEEVLLADNEEEMNDWLAKLNYAAAFRTSGVRIRGAIGSLYEGQNRRVLRRLGSAEGQAVQTPSGEVTITRSRIDQKMAEDILAARRDIMRQKVADANEKLAGVEKKLEVQLRNSRHLQIMSPIQPKTREQMLHSAARMATQVQWTRVEMWRLKCHRDILEMDLDEEHQAVGLGSEHALESGAALAGAVAVAPGLGGVAAEGSSSTVNQLEQKPGLSREDSLASSASTVLQCSPRPTTHCGSLASGSGGSGSVIGVVTDLPLSDASATPSSATPTVSTQHNRHKSAEHTPTTAGSPGVRKASVSSAVSAGSHSALVTPSRAARRPSLPNESTLQRQTPTTAVPAEDSQLDHTPEPNDEDADEQTLLQKTGLLEPGLSLVGAEAGSGRPALAEESSTPLATGTQHHYPASLHSLPQAQGMSQQSSPSQHDKNKIRRSLHRTLREGAGHLSHHRGKKTRETTSAGGSDDAAGEPGVLERGSGSFVVHGKKASVISFGGDLQSILPSDERLRQRMSLQQSSMTTGNGQGDAAQSLAEEAEGEGVRGSTPAGNNDFRAMVLQHDRNQERRESAASTSTATARSFRELHKKYSSVRAASKSSTGGRSASRRDDGESEAAVSSGLEGGHTPLTPALEESEGSGEKHFPRRGRGRMADDESQDDSDAVTDDDEDDYDNDSIYSVNEDVPSQFFTSEPPASPRARTPEVGDDESALELDSGSATGLAAQTIHA
ncbi:guanyl-nucleotide exchange factor [Grosmannia clavigera kw1407]|uniref:Guanyl-nucleotide exchange factor n=1 Tax=Grosmannia clavigera (strain kw1407 / UAMH 11150) TaxID=655863 RepID=F0XMB8_GROCL|nr:guanyl-nucleotide exchange factor [Grosmannia clavigera kw1407]EFX01000.1 guanyl-nucleotide exchange factor [Grosmannia clavigera kw1407]